MTCNAVMITWQWLPTTWERAAMLGSNAAVRGAARTSPMSVSVLGKRTVCSEVQW